MRGWFYAAGYAAGVGLIIWGVWVNPPLRKPLEDVWKRVGVKLTPEVLVGIILFLALSILLGMVIGLWILGLLSANIRIEGIPGFYWDNLAHPQVWPALLKGMAIAVPVIALAGFLLGRRPPKLHGEARWANRADVARVGLFADDGILLGRAFQRPLRLGGTEHVLVEAPTRAGKGVGIVIPNLLEWKGSTVVLDVKQENWEKSAGYRERELGQRVLLLDPLDAGGRTARYNPLAYIDRRDPVQVVHELQKVGIMLYPEPVHGESFWMDMARTAFIGLAAYVAACEEKPFSIGQVYREVTGAPSQKAILALIETMQKQGRPLSREAASGLSSYAANSDNTYAGIRSTLLSKINLWVNPHVDAATSESDFSLAMLREGAAGKDGQRQAVSLYLGVSPNDIETIAPLYNLIVQQIIDQNVRELFDEKRMFKVLVLLDEFARLGQATMLAQAFSYVAGYGLRLLPVVQSRSQLRAIYGPDVAKEIITNCGAEVIFGVKEDDICRELESRIGYFTFKATSRSRKIWESFDGSLSTSDQRRALMMAQEIRDMDPSRALIFRAAMPALQAKKLRYYEDRRYMDRVLSPPVVSGRMRPPVPALPQIGLNDGAAADVTTAVKVEQPQTNHTPRPDHDSTPDDAGGLLDGL